MLDMDGLVCEYDGYEIPEKGEDTPENRMLRNQAMKEAKEQARKLRAERMK